MKYLLISWGILFPGITAGQWENSGADELVSMQNEMNAEDEELVQDDEETLKTLEYFKSNPLSVNAPIEQLNEFPLLNPLLVSNLVNYRKYLGDLVSLYELQAVPGFTIEIIKRILPFICLNEEVINITNFRDRFVRGKTQVQVRPVVVTPRQDNNSGVKWLGDGLSLLARYKYRYKHLLQYGFAIEKDAGERLVTGKFPSIADFNSFHFICRNLGVVKTLAVGDFTINLGQGLIQWHNQAFKKSAAVLNVKRQGDVLKPYQSSGEFYFFRGAGATIRKKSLEGTFFFSVRKVTANISNDVTGGVIATSFNPGGLHRTESEISDKNSLHISTAGASARKLFGSGHIAVNVIKHFFSPPIFKRMEPYNIYSVRGSSWMNVSSDFAFTIRNCHVFGEAAADKNGNPGIIVGLLASLHRILDVSCVYRNLSPAYQALFGNAFMENTLPSNENGFYVGSSIRATRSLTLDMYADIFSFYWMKFRVDAPSAGSQHLVQLTWKPSRPVEVYSRWRRKMKPLNEPSASIIDFPDLHIHSTWRTHINFDVNRLLTLRSRVELCKFERPNSTYSEPGYVYFIDVLRRTSDNRRSANCRIMYFETETYDSRIYAYENDLFLTGSTTAFFGSGMRVYFNLRQNFRIKKLSSSTLIMSLKLASTIYTSRSSKNYADDDGVKPNRMDFRFQLFFRPSS